jgi:hypothetical protein
MTTKTKRNILIALAIVVGIGVSVWYDLAKPANERIQAGVQKILAKEPRVKPLYDEAMKDGVLTILEAKEIIDRANELKGQ